MLKPEAEYCPNSSITISMLEDAFNKNETVVGKVLQVDPSRRIIIVSLAPNIIGRMSWDDYTIYELRSNPVNALKIPSALRCILGKIIRVKIKSINKEHIILSRKDNMLEALQCIRNSSCDTIYNARIMSACSMGAFLDIGEGISALCPLREFTCCKVALDTWVHAGERCDVVIIEPIHEEDDYKITCSRKRVDTGKYEEYQPGMIVQGHLSDPVCQDSKITGYFVEISPNVCGIANVGGVECNIGDIVWLKVKQVEPEKRKMHLQVIY